jgi:MFS transporter, DHA2 family, multidrug resistance protein
MRDSSYIAACRESSSGIMAPIVGRPSERYSAGILGGRGLALLSLGMALLAMVRPTRVSSTSFGAWPSVDVDLAFAALAVLSFGLAGREGATLAPVLCAVFATTGGGMSVIRLAATPRSPS